MTCTLHDIKGYGKHNGIRVFGAQSEKPYHIVISNWKHEFAVLPGKCFH